MADEKSDQLKELEKTLAKELDQEVVAGGGAKAQAENKAQNISGTPNNVSGEAQAAVVSGGAGGETPGPVQFKSGAGDPTGEAASQLKEVDSILGAGDTDNVAKIESIREEIKDQEVRVDPADSIPVQIDESAPLPEQKVEVGPKPPGPKVPLPQRIKEYMMGPFKTYLVKWVYWVRTRNRKQWAILGLILLLVAGMVGLVRVGSKLFFSDPLEVEGDLSRVADRELDPAMQPGNRPFQDVAPLTDFIVEMEKVVVNIQRSENSGSNPMATVIVLIECENQETAVEVKDREILIKDVIQRVMEKMSYDRLFSAEGKIEFKDRVRQAINAELTAGKARSVFINLIILKP